VLFECARQAIRAYGTEINPAAVCMSRIASLSNRDSVSRTELLKKLEKKFMDLTRRKADRTVDRLVQGRQSFDLDEAVILDALICRADKKAKVDLHEIWRELKATVTSLPYSDKPIAISLCDARKTHLDSSSIDLVISSPPYINVFNYHQQYRGAMQKLGWKILAVAPSEIGANRKHRGNRLLTVVQYCLDMGKVFEEMERVCKPTGPIISL
jgi:hypothetical protein